MRILNISVAVGIGLLLVACGGKSSVGMAFATAKAEKEVALSTEADAPSCKVLLEVAYVENESHVNAREINDAIEQKLFGVQGLAMQQAVDSFANEYTSQYKKNLTPFYQEDKGDAQRHAWYEYHYTLNTETKVGRDGKVIVYTIHLDFYEGGAHGIQQLLTMNFDAESGQQLTLQDVFVPGYEARLNELLLGKLMSMADAGNLNELKEKGYLYAMDIFPPENFVLDDSEITFIYNPYEIAPYSTGMITLSLSYADVKDLLKE